jgi:hypothetical protein
MASAEAIGAGPGLRPIVGGALTARGTVLQAPTARLATRHGSLRSRARAQPGGRARHGRVAELWPGGPMAARVDHGLRSHESCGSQARGNSRAASFSRSRRLRRLPSLALGSSASGRRPALRPGSDVKPWRPWGRNRVAPRAPPQVRDSAPGPLPTPSGQVRGFPLSHREGLAPSSHEVARLAGRLPRRWRAAAVSRLSRRMTQRPDRAGGARSRPRSADGSQSPHQAARTQRSRSL